ncbi:MAG: hypothetical protein VR67_17015 [Peptococcaceae bacterium BRH_c8a]|nr:MAG: hypothetical protein VR67_17015 [Peptococcaceae bacterium BRH_c8a]
MQCEHYFYNCSKEYIDSINHNLYQEIIDALDKLPKLATQSEINRHLFRALLNKGWSYDTCPPGVKGLSSGVLDACGQGKTSNNQRSLCLTSSTLGANWHTDFAKSINGKLIHIEAQFGKVESMFKDFCGFRIAYFERRLALGIKIVISEPYKYFSHRKASIGGMAYFDIAKRTLSAIGLNCPIWLIGLKE